MKIYWAASNVLQGSQVSRALYYPPEPINPFKDFKTQIKHNNFKLCPAYLSHTENLFSLKFPISYDLSFDNSGIGTSTLDQSFFDNFIFVRDLEQRLISFNVRYIFFAEEPCKISLQPAYLEDNDLTNKTISLPGMFDAGQWFRTTDYSVIVKQDVTQLKINSGDVYNYLKVHTDEPIEFVKFDYTDELDKIQREILQSKRFLGNKSPKLSYYYSLFKQSLYKKKIIRLIKENILE